MTNKLKNTNEVAEFFINSGKRDKTDISVLIKEAGKKRIQEVGKEEAAEVMQKYMDDQSVLFTVEGLAGFLTDMNIQSVSFVDVMDGSIQHEAILY